MAYGTVNADVIQTSTSGGILGAGNASIMKNRIINGAMVIDQRNAGASVTPSSGTSYTLDRWATSNSQASKYSVQQIATTGNALAAGFSYALGITSLSAYSLGAGDYFNIQQRIEGFNTADLQFGTASAKTVTLSFWVSSSLTGTFGGVLQNSATNYCYPFTYTISSANTYEYKTVTITGATAGTWVGATNGRGLYVSFGLGVGSTYSGTAGSWASADYESATGATSVVGTNGATFYITGVQLEVGSNATGYEYRQYQQELYLCQRYYINYGTSFHYDLAQVSTYYTTRRRVAAFIAQGMRTTPTATYTLGSDGGYSGDVFSISNNYNWDVYAISSGPGATIYLTALAFSAEL